MSFRNEISNLMSQHRNSTRDILLMGQTMRSDAEENNSRLQLHAINGQIQALREEM